MAAHRAALQNCRCKETASVPHSANSSRANLGTPLRIFPSGSSDRDRVSFHVPSAADCFALRTDTTASSNDHLLRWRRRGAMHPATVDWLLNTLQVQPKHRDIIQIAPVLGISFPHTATERAATRPPARVLLRTCRGESL